MLLRLKLMKSLMPALKSKTPIKFYPHNRNLKKTYKPIWPRLLPIEVLVFFIKWRNSALINRTIHQCKTLCKITLQGKVGEGFEATYPLFERDPLIRGA